MTILGEAPSATETAAGTASLISVSPQATIRRVAVSSMDNNIYLLTAPETGDQILIDAADDLGRIVSLMEAAADDAPQTALRVIITTHAHSDHIRALAPLAGATAATVLAGADDVAVIERQTGVRANRGLLNGDKVRCGPLSLDVIGLRGHTPGSVALAYVEDGQPPHLFTGDSLFPGGVGNTDGDAGRFRQLMGDVTARLFDVYGDDAIVHPGHGAPTTLGAERPHLREWWERGW
jgi:glyoxylase-like metal-dependent hydrolase (beta-lactamase superfamily II)